MTAFSSSRPQHQVIINFYNDSKNAPLHRFFDQLVKALKRNTINVCTNTDKDISQNVNVQSKSREPRIALVIFSGKYTESTTCLTELAKINECVEEGKVMAIPIFFRLDESTVKDLRGQFGDTLKHMSHVSKETKNNWKAAMKSISYEPGYKVDRESENYIVKKIVDAVEEKMNKITLEESQKASKPKNILKDRLNICCGILLLLFTLQQFFYTHLDNERTKKSKDQNIGNFYCSTFTNSSINGKVKPPNIQVFINYNEDQVGQSFISHLVDALERSKVNVFINSKEKIGVDHKNRFKRIEGSGIAIVVFSSEYAESDDCLDELVKIRERKQKGLLKVFPIFYKVRISDVKNLKGAFGDHFRDKERMYKSEIDKIERWKEAIESVTHLHALIFDEIRYYLFLHACTIDCELYKELISKKFLNKCTSSTGGEASFLRKVVEEVLKVLLDISVVKEKPIFW